MDREPSARPTSSRPPSVVPVPRTAMVSTLARPITQQGLTGLRAAQTPKSGASRIYRDKRYYVSQIQSHMSRIKDEIARLEKSSKEYRITSLNHSEYRRQAEELAKELTERQETLNEYNTVLDIHLSRTSMDHVHAETNELRKRNEHGVKELENAYNLKLKYEQQLEIITKELAEEDQLTQSFIEKMSPEDREKYYQLTEESEKLMMKTQSMQADIEKCKEMIKVHMETISKSKNKQRKLELMKSIRQLEKQKAEIQESLRNTLTPEQQREVLLQQVKQNKADIEALLKVEKSLKEDYEMETQRLDELNRELEGKDNARLKKHKELRDRGEHMDQFISTFETKSKEMETKIKEIQQKVLNALEQASRNVTDVNFEEIDNLDNQQIDSGQQTNLETLSKRSEIITKQIERFKLFKEKYEKELVMLSEKRKEKQKEIDEYRNVDGKKEELMQKMNQLESECSSLRSTLESTESAVVEAQRRNEELIKKLNDNESYHLIKRLETEAEILKTKNDELEEKVSSTLSSHKVNDTLKELTDIIAKRNEELIQELKAK